MRAFFAAVEFLTIVRVGRLSGSGEKWASGTLFWFPVVGLCLGWAAASLDHWLASLFPIPARSALTLAALVVLTGGLHLDGLADTADGLFSFRGKESILEIMRDSRTGAMGVIAVSCLLIIKFALIFSLPEGARRPAFLLMPLFGRAALVLMITFFPYARKEAGFATPFLEYRSKWYALWAAALSLLAGWLLYGAPGAVSALAAGAAAGLAGLFFKEKIGGYTGDTLGASCELIEIIPLLAAAAA
ncbi:MAG: cobalamin 5'-phosphate synthase [Elusimicrobia bacterium RIFCSPHIGHO2_01_FULL_64_10]|nr:MAG: cobalamin 5'-phosphate synthase [Elusimicrobia bacterium RIFCSPHIGHO2_01_FULL_64_10]